MVKLRRGAGLLLAVILFGVGVLLGLRLGWLAGPRSAGRSFDTPSLLLQVQTLSQLVTVKYVIEKAEPWDDPPKNLLGQFIAGDNRILLLAHGIVKAGVDLSKLTPKDLQVEGTQIVVRLPPARITDAYLDETQTKVIERTTGFLRSFNKNLEQDIRRTAVEDMRNAALRGGILQDAEERAQAQLGNLFLRLGFAKVEFLSATDRAPKLLDLIPRESASKTNR